MWMGWATPGGAAWARALVGRAGRLTAAIAALLLVAGCYSSAGGPPATPGPPTSPNGILPRFDHIFLVVLENTSYGSALASPAFQQVAAQGATLTNYHAVAHNSLPNYLALTSGILPTAQTRRDCPQFDCQYSGRNLADQLNASGRAWKEYVGGTTTPCLTPAPGSHDPFVDGYVLHHNPFAYYPQVGAGPNGGSASCRDHLRPLSEVGVDAASGSLPEFGLLVPDSCEDGHDVPCSDSRPGGVETAGQWVARELTTLVQSKQWTDRSLLVVTFDESIGSDTSSCCGGSDGGRVLTILISGSIRPSSLDAEVADHYSMLRTVEQGLGLDVYLGQAAGRAPLTGAFATG
jgi:phosphatidylinositol-3-phosphatase